ncbi:hypothetical protein U9M48_006312 [Paspalum notatum var. saurae]|uniref:Guanine nucleotide-binding protein alpha subunit n=1 Tax=Paspalum notatum var. saurae TaxID=547442 RepID=A0AAQ3PZJ8_PASNO
MRGGLRSSGAIFYDTNHTRLPPRPVLTKCSCPATATHFPPPRGLHCRWEQGRTQIRRRRALRALRRRRVAIFADPRLLLLALTLRARPPSLPWTSFLAATSGRGRAPPQTSAKCPGSRRDLHRRQAPGTTRPHSLNDAEAAENAKSADIDRRILLETKAEQHIHKLLLLGAGESGKSTIFKQIKLLFQTGFDEAELRSYTSVIHANVYQTIKILYEGAKELAQVEPDASKYLLTPDNQEIGEKLSEIGARLHYPFLNKELVQDVRKLWQDPAIQETYSRGSILQVPDCAQYFMENLDRLAEVDYVPTKEDVLHARVRTNGVVEIQFSPLGESKRGGEVYRLYDVGGQRNERRKWIHLFEGVNAVIFCAAISEYDQMLYEDATKNRMMETKELFDWVLKQRCFEVPLSVCEWFKDYQPIAPGKQEVEHAYEFVKKKFEELYFQSSKPDRVDRVFKIYRTTALDQKLVKKTFKLIDESMRRSREGT